MDGLQDENQCYVGVLTFGTNVWGIKHVQLLRMTNSLLFYSTGDQWFSSASSDNFVCNTIYIADATQWPVNDTQSPPNYNHWPLTGPTMYTAEVTFKV